MTMARGQAVVETALASLIIVTVILFGIHFAEVGYASIKTHEAGAFAMWDATGRPIHSLPGVTYGGYAGSSAARAQSRYADFDSRAGSTGASFTQAVTRATGMSVTCASSGAVAGPTPPGVTGGVLPDTGGATCQASADLFALRIPREFAEGSGGGFFNKGTEAKHVKRSSYVSCGMGRPVLGACKGQLGILLGDWALSLSGEEATAPGNPPFESSVEQIWRDNGDKQGPDAEDFATKWAGYAPYHLPFEIKNDTEHTLTEVPGGSGSFLP